jgi:hypothetical protein
VCDTFVNKSPTQLSDQANLAKAISDTAQKTRDALRTAVDQYRELEGNPFPDQRDLFNLKSYINKLVLTNFNNEILLSFQNFIEGILDKKDQITDIVNQRRQTGHNVPPEPEVDSVLKQAKDEIASAKQNTTVNQTFDSISNFATKAKPYVEKIIKGAKIALTVMGMFV